MRAQSPSEKLRVGKKREKSCCAVASYCFKITVGTHACDMFHEAILLPELLARCSVFLEAAVTLLGSSGTAEEFTAVSPQMVLLWPKAWSVSK